MVKLMLPVTISRLWLRAGGQTAEPKMLLHSGATSPTNSRATVIRGGLRYAVLAFLAAFGAVVQAPGMSRSASASETGSAASTASPGRLAAVRFVVTPSSPVPGGPDTFEVWVDGNRRVNGLDANVVSPYLLVENGVRSFEVRSATSIVVGEVRNVEGASSTTFVVAYGAGPAHLLGIPDSNPHAAPSVRLINATSISQKLQVPGEAAITTVEVAPLAASKPVPIPAQGEASLRFQGEELSFEPVVGAPSKILTKANSSIRGEVGSRLLVVAAAVDGAGGYSGLTFPSTRYPANLLPVDEGAPGSGLALPARPPEFWIRRLLAALVLVLVVAATITTLRSFRVQSLHSRVRARME